MSAVAPDVQPVAHERLDRFITFLVTILPVVGLGVAVWQLWAELIGWNDVLVFLIMYVITGLGVTVGFHRLFTHRAFKTGPVTRYVLAAMGSMAIEGPVISWVADHRKHHAFSDREGDPHSPHVEHGHGLSGALRGLWHAHVGWLFIHTQRGKHERYARDLVNDPIVSRVHRQFPLWTVVGLAIPFGLGWLFGGTIWDGFTGMLWGGLVRMLVVHHVTYSINSLCHFFGSRRFATKDESRNLAWVAALSFGEGWHNNHHAFPTSAAHGLTRFERVLDPSANLIWLMEKVGLAWDVVRVSPERQAARAASVPAG